MRSITLHLSTLDMVDTQLEVTTYMITVLLELTFVRTIFLMFIQDGTLHLLWNQLNEFCYAFGGCCKDILTDILSVKMI